MLEVGENVGIRQNDGSIEHVIVYSVKGSLIQVINEGGDKIIDIDLRKTPHRLRTECVLLKIALSKKLIKQILSVAKPKDLDDIGNHVKAGKVLKEFIEDTLDGGLSKCEIDDEISVLVNKMFDKSRAQQNRDIEDA